MLLVSLLAMSAELLAGVGKAAPNLGTKYGYKTWSHFFFQLSYIKGLPLGLEPYMRVQHMDHPEYTGTDTVNGIVLGANLKESILVYEMGLSGVVYSRGPLYLSLGLAGTGNFCHWEKQVYGSGIAIIDQVSPGVLLSARQEYRRDYHPWLDEKRVTMVLGFSTRLNYMKFRPDAWPCADWFYDISATVGVRW